MKCGLVWVDFPRKVKLNGEGEGVSLVHQESGTEGTRARLGEEYVVV